MGSEMEAKLNALSNEQRKRNEEIEAYGVDICNDALVSHLKGEDAMRYLVLRCASAELRLKEALNANKKLELRKGEQN